VLLSLASFGSVRTGVVKPAGSENYWTAGLRARLNEAHQLLVDSNYQEATAVYESACRDSVAAGQGEWAGMCFNNLGACYFATFRYGEAIRAFLEARAIAVAIHDWASLGALNTNISGIYLEMGDLDAAVLAAQQGAEVSARQGFPAERSKALLQLGLLRARQGRMEDASTLVADSIRLADQQGDLPAVARAWDRMGDEFLKQGQLEQADRALTEGFRLRQMHGLRNRDSSYLNLGKLRLAQGDPLSATILLDQAVKRQRLPDSLIPAWNIFQARGRARQAQGQLQEAFEDFGAALNLARQWRLEVVAADAKRASSEAGLEQIYSSYIDAGNSLYFVSRRNDVARATFQAAEENRAATLQALLTAPGDWRRGFTLEYWEELAQLRASEVALLHEDSPAGRERITRQRARVVEMEGVAGAQPLPPRANLLAKTQRALAPDAAFLSFHMGDGASYLWAVTRASFSVYRLPSKSRLSSAITAFATAVEAGDATALPLGAELYRTLFGAVGAVVGGKQRWILALDERLFAVPFAALVIGGAPGQPIYLAERHVLQISTGARTFASAVREPWAQSIAGPFLGIGDAVYNTADARWKSSPRSEAGDWQLPRLVASREEIESCGLVWARHGAPLVLLEGVNASRARFNESLRQSPGVIHFATHFLEGAQTSHPSMIALSLAPNQQPETLSSLDLARARVNAGLVVMSGCSSGRGETSPGAGLMGLTHAWMGAGARAVAASHWSTPDDNGILFKLFYEHFLRAPDAGPAMALRKAQMDMMQSKGWRAQARYWAAFYLTGNS
jgi:CHAT domain-containing protein